MEDAISALRFPYPWLVRVLGATVLALSSSVSVLAQGTGGQVQPVRAESAAASPAAQPADTAARIAIVVGFMRCYDSRSTIDKSVTDALSLTKDAETLTVPQLIVTKDDGMEHGFSTLEDGRFLLARLVPGEDRVYLVGKDWRHIAALIKRKGQAPVIMPSGRADRETREEMAFWAEASEHLPTADTHGLRPSLPCP